MRFASSAPVDLRSVPARDGAQQLLQDLLVEQAAADTTSAADQVGARVSETVMVAACWVACRALCDQLRVRTILRAPLAPASAKMSYAASMSSSRR